MRTEAQLKRDGDRIEEIMRGYTGTTGAHFGFIAMDGANGEKRQYFVGGRADLCGICLAEAIATFVHITPGMSEDFIDLVSSVAHDMLKDMNNAQ